MNLPSLRVPEKFSAKREKSTDGSHESYIESMTEFMTSSFSAESSVSSASLKSGGRGIPSPSVRR